MKKRIFLNTILAVFLSFAITACNKDFLEKEPIGKVGIEDLFKDVDGLKLALNGSYNKVAYYYSGEFGLLGDVAGDELNIERKNNSKPVLENEFSFKSAAGDDEYAVGHIWTYIYEALNNVNRVIQYAPSLKEKYPERAATIDSIYANALILRAVCHFDLSKVYAQTYTYQQDGIHLGVPILLKTPKPGEPVSRKTMKETYAQIIADLNDGMDILKDYQLDNKAIVSYPAAQALLSRIYLYMDNWEKSKEYADAVIGNNKYSLATAGQYAKMFIDWDSGNEVIWQLNCKEQGPSNINMVYSAGNKYQYYPTRKLLDLFDSDDIRGTQTIRDFINKNSKVVLGKLSTKYGRDSLNELKPYSIKVVRLSEMYLNRAEANWNMGKYNEAAEDLRIISQRAHPNRPISITYSSADDLFEQISKERRRELCFEGHRFYDIKRSHKPLDRSGDSNSSVKHLDSPNNRFVLPIPSKEVDANPAMLQNPGLNN